MDFIVYKTIENHKIPRLWVTGCHFEDVYLTAVQLIALKLSPQDLPSLVLKF